MSTWPTESERKGAFEEFLDSFLAHKNYEGITPEKCRDRLKNNFSDRTDAIFFQVDVASPAATRNYVDLDQAPIKVSIEFVASPRTIKRPLQFVGSHRFISVSALVTNDTPDTFPWVSILFLRQRWQLWQVVPRNFSSSVDGVDVSRRRAWYFAPLCEEDDDGVTERKLEEKFFLEFYYDEATIPALFREKKFGKRTQQLMTDVEPTIVVDASRVEWEGKALLSDSGVLLNDGVGMISRNASKQVAQLLGYGNEPPAAIQIRFREVKGMVMTQRLSKATPSNPKDLWFAPSQLKWSVPTSRKTLQEAQTLYVVAYPPNVLEPTKPQIHQMVLVMEGLAVDAGMVTEFHRAIASLQQEVFADLYKTFQDPQRLLATLGCCVGEVTNRTYNYEAMRLCAGGDEPANHLAVTTLLSLMARCGFSYDNSAYMVAAAMNLWLYLELDSKLRKSHIVIPGTWEVFILCDLDQKLLPHEALFYLRDQTGVRYLCGPALVARNPVLLPTDVQKFTFLSESEVLERFDGLPSYEYTNVLVLSAHRTCIRAPADFLGGGDYDGDRVIIVTYPPIVNCVAGKVEDPLVESLAVDEQVTKTKISGYQSLPERIAAESLDTMEMQNTAGRYSNMWRSCVEETPGGVLREDARIYGYMSQLAIDKKLTPAIISHCEQRVSRSHDKRQPEWYKASKKTDTDICKESASVIGRWFRQDVRFYNDNLPKFMLQSVFRNETPGWFLSPKPHSCNIYRIDVSQLPDIVDKQTLHDIAYGVKRACLEAIANKEWNVDMRPFRERFLAGSNIDSFTPFENLPPDERKRRLAITIVVEAWFSENLYTQRTRKWKCIWGGKQGALMSQTSQVMFWLGPIHRLFFIEMAVLCNGTQVVNLASLDDPSPPRIPSTGTTPTPARSRTASTPARSGTTPTPAKSGTTPTPAGSGTTPTPAKSGTTPTPARSGTTPTPARSSSPRNTTDTPGQPSDTPVAQVHHDVYFGRIDAVASKWRCVECGVTDDRREYISRHIGHTHKPLLHFKCPWCSIIYKQKASLFVHVRSDKCRRKPENTTGPMAWHAILRVNSACVSSGSNAGAALSCPYALAIRRHWPYTLSLALAVVALAVALVW